MALNAPFLNVSFSRFEHPLCWYKFFSNRSHAYLSVLLNKCKARYKSPYFRSFIVFKHS